MAWVSEATGAELTKYGKQNTKAILITTRGHLDRVLHIFWVSSFGSRLRSAIVYLEKKTNKTQLSNDFSPNRLFSIAICRNDQLRQIARFTKPFRSICRVVVSPTDSAIINGHTTSKSITIPHYANSYRLVKRNFANMLKKSTKKKKKLRQCIEKVTLTFQKHTEQYRFSEIIIYKYHHANYNI